MYVDLNSVPEDFRTGDLINVWQQQGILVNDPTKTINTIPSTSTTGVFAAISDPLEDRLVEMEKQLELVKLETTLLRLKILSMEGKFTQEEVSNIRKMLMSEDEASKTLASTIIENA
jgi:cell shape-determining protein MreC